LGALARHGSSRRHSHWAQGCWRFIDIANKRKSALPPGESTLDAGRIAYGCCFTFVEPHYNLESNGFICLLNSHVQSDAIVRKTASNRLCKVPSRYTQPWFHASNSEPEI
jgi:hypothetical protein